MAEVPSIVKDWYTIPLSDPHLSAHPSQDFESTISTELVSPTAAWNEPGPAWIDDSGNPTGKSR